MNTSYVVVLEGERGRVTYHGPFLDYEAADEWAVKRVAETANRLMYLTVISVEEV